MSTLTLAVCAHHAERCIGNCLKSILGQTVPPDEVILCVHELSDPTVEGGTERRKRIRLISARLATRAERKRYEEETLV